MRIPFTINDDIIISNNDKDNDVPNGCLINTARARLGRTQHSSSVAASAYLTLAASLQLSSSRD